MLQLYNIVWSLGLRYLVPHCHCTPPTHVHNSVRKLRVPCTHACIKRSHNIMNFNSGTTSVATIFCRNCLAVQRKSASLRLANFHCTNGTLALYEYSCFMYPKLSLFIRTLKGLPRLLCLFVRGVVSSWIVLSSSTWAKARLIELLVSPVSAPSGPCCTRIAIQVTNIIKMHGLHLVPVHYIFHTKLLLL